MSDFRFAIYDFGLDLTNPKSTQEAAYAPNDSNLVLTLSVGTRLGEEKRGEGKIENNPKSKVHNPQSNQQSTIENLKSKITADPFAQSMGIELLEMKPGYSRMAMALQPHMVNFHGTPHGGAIFTLADAAFAAACNSHGQVAVALSMTINYRAAVAPDTRLLVEAVEESLGGRTGLYRMTVTADDKQKTLVAVCDGTAYRKKEMIGE